MEQIKKLLEFIKNDTLFVEEILPLMKESNEAAIFATAKKKGLNITKSDWQAYTEWQKNMRQMLSEIAKRGSAREEILGIA